MMPSMSKMLSASNLIKTNLPAVRVILKEIEKFKIDKKIINNDVLEFKHEIKLDNISFKYKSTNKILFSELNAQIKKG